MAQIYYSDPQSSGINVQSPQSKSTPRRLTLIGGQTFCFVLHEKVQAEREKTPKTINEHALLLDT